MYA
ncbi:Protein of unknown function [Bacillus toyonensis]|jgi:hydrocephalus-inducing protein